MTAEDQSRLKSFVVSTEVLSVNPFTPKSDQVQISPVASLIIITSHSMKNLAFHSLLRLKDDSCTSSHYLTYTFLLKRLGECTFRAWD